MSSNSSGSTGTKPERTVEAPSLPVALLDDDLERSRPLPDRITLCVGEQPVSDGLKVQICGMLAAEHVEALDPLLPSVHWLGYE